MDDQTFKKMIEGLKEAQEGYTGDWLMEQFLKNSYGKIPKQEAMRRLREEEISE